MTRAHSATTRTRRLKRIAVASGLLLVAALFNPAAAQADTDATFSEAQLTAAHEAVADAGIGGTAYAVDSESGTVTVLHDETVSDADLDAIRAEAGSLSRAIEFEAVPGTFEKYVQGGDAIYADLGWRCSAGFNVRDSAGTWYFLTAGHCTDDPYGPTPPYPLWSDGVSQIGTTAASNFPGGDYGLVRYDSQQGAPSTVNLYNGTSQAITSFSNAFVGQAACRSGSTTGLRCGSVNGLGFTVDYGGGDIVYNMIRTNICAEPGDSGGPLFAGATGLGLTSGGNGNCSVGGTTFFQPVVAAASAYGVSVP
ncbi:MULTISPECIES: S1 family peptidase [unclassified Streptomyces]|uniref:S1 family peptidase n=1 Tax=unclassified Streptomyces TaxID=2593676 RepID=UPI000CD5100C|nr:MULTISPECIES: S1 family peptidase [unclassified Streptomyces]